MESGLEGKFAGFQDFATIEALDVLGIVVFGDQARACVFADRIGHEVLSDEACKSIALAASGRDANEFVVRGRALAAFIHLA